MKRLLLLGALSLIAMLMFGSVAAGAHKQATNEAGAHKPAKKTVLIQDFSFSPAKITVKRGTKVTWVNKDPAPHTVTANNGAFDSGVLQQGDKFTRTFRKAGKFRYHCEIHPEMMGSVRVKQRR